jgi:hypothetical protein
MDLSQLYGPGYAGYLQGMQSSQNRNMQALQGMGMLSNMQTQDMQRNAMQAQLAERQRQAQQQVEAQERMQGLLSQPDDVIQGMLGMPANQVRALFTMGGPGSLSKVLEKNYEMPSDLRMINALPEGPKRTAAIEAKTGISPQFFQTDLGGQQAGFVRDPVTQQVQPVFQAEKTAAPGSRPAWLNADGSVNEELYQRQAGLNRAGAAQGPSLNINSPLMPGQAAQNTNDQGLLDAGQMMSGMSAIQQEYRPEFQTLGTRWNALKTGMKERLGLGVTKDDKALLEDFTRYRGRSANALNQYIKAMTGAALTEAEAERLTKAIPFAGTGMWDGDSPTEFKAKMDAVTKDLRMATARRSYIKRQGFSLGQVQLDQMPKIMNDRGAQIKSEIQSGNPSMQEQEMGRMVRRRLAEEFGLVYEQ